ncbi:MAG TPA: hypothetical protein VEU33_37105 [Archangium sp.]|nr:hypothetical protein [Archangium sp.]
MNARQVYQDEYFTMLVRSSVGMMQIQRHARRDGVERLSSQDEDELLKYLARDV